MWSHNFVDAPALNRANARLGTSTRARIVTPAHALDTLELANAANMVINPTYLAQRTRSCKPDMPAEH
jgi:NADH dehydrogenase (ubiquinone) 1 alpha subcomplex subunit 6